MPTLRLPDGSTVPVVDGMILGRIRACHVTLDDEKVSRKHARIVLEGGVAEVEDLGSRNGVFLNGHRVLRRLMRDGDVLTIGRVQLTFEADDVTAPASQSGPAPGADPLAGRDLLDDEPPEAPRRATPAPRAEAPQPEVEVLEFVDEIVEVRKRVEPRARPGGGAASRPSPAVERRSGVLQFSKQAEAGALGEDVAQLGGIRRLGIVLLGIAFAVAVGWTVMTWTS